MKCTNKEKLSSGVKNATHWVNAKLFLCDGRSRDPLGRRKGCLTGGNQAYEKKDLHLTQEQKLFCSSFFH